MEAQPAFTIPDLLSRCKVEHIFEVIDQNTSVLVADAIAINQIPAPTFREGLRANFILDRFRSFNLDAHMDSFNNVVASTSGGLPGPGILLSANLDTVFPETVNPTARVEPKKVVGPGIGDNSLGLATLLALAEIIERSYLDRVPRILFAATAGSEGAGNFSGMRRVVKRLRGRFDRVITLKGHELGRIGHYTVGTRRYKIWNEPESGSNGTDLETDEAEAVDPSDFLADLFDHLRNFPKPDQKYSISLDPLGPNLLASRFGLDGLGLDLKYSRGVDLRNAERSLRRLVERVGKGRRLRAVLKRLGGWEEASLPTNHPLVQTVQTVHRTLGIPSFSSPIGSDGVLPLLEGIPAVTLGLTYGRNKHTEDEWVELEPISKGIKQVFLTLLALGEADRREARGTAATQG